jgi:hypothetical protein
MWPFSSSSRAARSASSPAAGSESSTAKSPLTEVFPLVSTSAGAGASLSNWRDSASVSTLPETKNLVVRNALSGLFRKHHFDICTVRELCELLDLSTNTPAFQALRTLHCMEYRDMDPALRERLPHMVGEALRPPPEIEAVDTVLDVMARRA